MGRLINIDNGGTLTDVCVIDGNQVYRTKTLTTPHDLSRCFFEGLAKVSKEIFGEEDVLGLVTSTDHIRYSTTQGTNALVERKGPRLGLIRTGTLSEADLRRDPAADAVFQALVGNRVSAIDLSLDGAALEIAVVRAVNALSSAGANRIVVAHGGADRVATESRIQSLLLRKFPQHLLGAVPILYTHEVVEDEDDVRRTWTALFNAFLHPAMERFLYNAEHKLRDSKAQSPLLIFRNDGNSARVAKTIALKTYSSGPRGGMEGSRAVAVHYGFRHLITMDVGGTTTDIGEVRNGVVRSHLRGQVEDVNVSFPLSDIHSVGVGGSSIIRVVDGHLEVGPQSVGSAPGPACFGLGGSEATITDAFLVLGLLDPASFFGGDLKLDEERARNVVLEQVGRPLGLSVEDAALAMERAWVEKVASSLKRYTTVSADTVLAAFGGAGPFAVCRIAEAAEIPRVLIPGLAAVFSAYGLGFSDIGHTYEGPLQRRDAATLRAVTGELTEQAIRGMYAEGFASEECELQTELLVSSATTDERRPLANGALPADLPADAQLSVAVSITKRLPHPTLQGHFGLRYVAASSAATRRVNGVALPLYRVEDQQPGACAAGPAVLEEAYFTGRIDAGWTFEINDSGDVLLSRA
ncbi:MAG: hydantoinase/oxoprolinase family protein [Gammaproteobacteria bacterium]|nr:hydantoinase/oxoprolinase family protein [Gammaproteobacteria bacterium]